MDLLGEYQDIWIAPLRAHQAQLRELVSEVWQPSRQGSLEVCILYPSRIWWCPCSTTDQFEPKPGWRMSRT